MSVVAKRGKPGARVALTGPIVAAAGVAQPAVAHLVAVGVVAVALVGVGTSLRTALLLPRLVDAAPEQMLTRVTSLLNLAHAAPVLVATPGLGLTACRLGLPAPLVAISAILVLASISMHCAQFGVTPGT